MSLYACKFAFLNGQSEGGISYAVTPSRKVGGRFPTSPTVQRPCWRGQCQTVRYHSKTYAEALLPFYNKGPGQETFANIAQWNKCKRPDEEYVFFCETVAQYMKRYTQSYT